MTVVEAYVGGTKLDLPENTKVLSAAASSVVIEGIAQNTTGSVFEPEVNVSFLFLLAMESFYCIISDLSLTYYLSS